MKKMTIYGSTDDLNKAKKSIPARRQCSLPSLSKFVKSCRPKTTAKGDPDSMEQLIFDLYLNTPSKPARQELAIQNYKNGKKIQSTISCSTVFKF